jgi:hypothetical protein
VLCKAGSDIGETPIAQLDLGQILPERLQEPALRALRPELYRSLRLADRK